MQLLRNILQKHCFIEKLEVSGLWLLAPKHNCLLWENPMEPPSLPLQIGMRYENTQSRDKRQPNENSIFFKMYKSNSLYNEQNKMFLSGGYYTSILLSKDAHHTVIVIVYFKTLPCLFKVMMDWFTGLFTPWSQSSACQCAKFLHMMHYSMDFWCYVYSSRYERANFLIFCYIICCKFVTIRTTTSFKTLKAFANIFTVLLDGHRPSSWSAFYSTVVSFKLALIIIDFSNVA